MRNQKHLNVGMKIWFPSHQKMPRSNFLDAFRLKIKIFWNDTFRYVAQTYFGSINNLGIVRDFQFQIQMIFDRKYFRFDELCESWTYFSFGKNQFFERSEVKPQVGEAETNVGVSQNDAGHVFDDVDTDDVTSDDITGKSTTKTGLNIFQKSRLSWWPKSLMTWIRRILMIEIIPMRLQVPGSKFYFHKEFEHAYKNLWLHKGFNLWSISIADWNSSSCFSA